MKIRIPAHNKKLTAQWLGALMAIPSGQPAIEIFGFHLVESQEHKRSLEIEAQRARVYKPQNLTTLNTMKSLFWGQDSKPFEINGQVAVVNSETQDMEIPTEATVTSPDGFVFETTELLYKAADRHISSDQPVKARPRSTHSATEALHLSGTGLLIRLANNTYEIKKNVRARQGTQRPLTITASHLLIYPETQAAQFSRNVRVKSAQFNVRGDSLKVNFQKNPLTGNLTAQKMLVEAENSKKIQADLTSLQLKAQGLTLIMSEKDSELERTEAVGKTEAVTSQGIQMKSDSLVSDTFNGKHRISLKGNVTILTQRRKGTCQEAVIYPEQGDIILEHGASVLQGEQLIQGDKIRFSTQRSDINVERVRGTMDRNELSSSPQES